MPSFLENLWRLATSTTPAPTPITSSSTPSPIPPPSTSTTLGPGKRATACISLIIELEGGYVNDPLDPGGETNYGISKRAYPSVDIKGLTPASASQIYYQDYWLPAHAHELPQPLDLFVFDCAVNQGVFAAVTILQDLCKVGVDGVMGPATIAAAQSLAAHTYLTARALKYATLTGFLRYGKGWYNRLFKVALAS